MTVVDGYRTTLLPGAADTYRRLHARIPDTIATALGRSGLISWRIWIDGQTLFHAIETRSGRQAMIDAMTELGQLEPEWDALIDALVSAEPAASAELPLVWSLVRGAQG